jgi:hypothetical protein
MGVCAVGGITAPTYGLTLGVILVLDPVAVLLGTTGGVFVVLLVTGFVAAGVTLAGGAFDLVLGLAVDTAGAPFTLLAGIICAATF